jgi:S-adenosylmethionine decarboxylase
MAHGQHIKVVGTACPDRLRDVAGVTRFLTELVEALGMRCLAQPHTYEVREEIRKLGVEPFEDEGGVTGIAVLSTSHCAIHTWPLRSCFVMDVYSCRDFDNQAVGDMLAAHFETRQLRITDLSFALDPDFGDQPTAPALELRA